MAHDPYSFGHRATWTRDYEADDLRSELRAEFTRPPICTCSDPSECWRPHFEDIADDEDPTPDEEDA